MEHGPGGGPILPAAPNQEGISEGWKQQEEPPELVRSPDFLSVLGDLGHVQDAALLRGLEEDIKASDSHVRHKHPTARRREARGAEAPPTPPPQQSGPAASAFLKHTTEWMRNSDYNRPLRLLQRRPR